DLNCVRGEDSLVRALWAGKPLLWHIYPQDGDTHIAKLDAWLARSPYTPPIRDLMKAWNQCDPQACTSLFQQACAPENWATWQADSAAWQQKLAQQPELADTLVAFCRNQLTLLPAP